MYVAYKPQDKTKKVFARDLDAVTFRAKFFYGQRLKVSNFYAYGVNFLRRMAMVNAIRPSDSEHTLKLMHVMFSLMTFCRYHLIILN